MIRSLAILIVILTSASRAWACASCGCTLSPNFDNFSDSGFKIDLRYDYVNQNQLRHGTSSISGTAASQMSNNGNSQEVESYTDNRYITASGDYTFNSSWRATAIIPWVVRSHSTLGTASNGGSPGPGGGQYTSNTSNLGDIKLIGRYQGFLDTHSFGTLFGLKLPTGVHNLTGTSTDNTAQGPAPIDRGLQPGTGTTDLILGVYYSEAMNKSWDLFTEGIYQYALNSIDQYRPGDSINANLGLRYMNWTQIIPQLQINARYVVHDSGANSDTISTGGTIIYLSPGAAFPVMPKLDIYAFFQVPIYENLLGVQLAPSYTASFGGRYSF